MNFLISLLSLYLFSGKLLLSNGSTLKKYDAIFNFGDSISDTGNLLRSSAIAFPVGKLPYGMTFFRHPTGRFSDGRLVVDFIAAIFGLPYLVPYLALGEDGQNFEHGVNFAVAGATALDAEFFYRRKMASVLWTNESLRVQLDWFSRFKSFLCSTKPDCEKHLKKSLFLMGEIGGNDYNYVFFSGGTIQQAEALVPIVVGTIIEATTVLIEEGAVELVVPGNFPLGCLAVYLTLFQSPNKMDYDSNGCLKALNYFSEFHNEQLKHALETLRHKYTNAKIIYSDYYGATMQFINSPLQFGFDKETLFKACCGGCGPYNYNQSASCGLTGSTVCEDPSTYFNWDGIHFTEAAYRIIAMGLVYGPFTTPPLTSSPLKDAL